MKTAYRKHDVPEMSLFEWQKTADLMARLFRVPAGLITRVWPTQIEVFVSSHTEGNPFEAHHKGDLNRGAYCETAMTTRSPLMVPNALQERSGGTTPMSSMTWSPTWAPH